MRIVRAPKTPKAKHFFSAKKTKRVDTNEIAFYILQNVKYLIPVALWSVVFAMGNTMVGMGSHEPHESGRERGSS